jgi:hypothetical protein
VKFSGPNAGQGFDYESEAQKAKLHSQFNHGFGNMNYETFGKQHPPTTAPVFDSLGATSPQEG